MAGQGHGDLNPDKKDPDFLLCPQGPNDGETNYGINEYMTSRVKHVNDPASTVFLYESKRAGSYLTGKESDVDPRHLKGSNFVFMDGHAKWSQAIPKFNPN